MADLRQAVEKLIEAGYSDDDIANIVDQIKWNTSKMINAGKTDEEIESEIGQWKFEKDGQQLPLFGTSIAPAASTPTPASGPNLATSNVASPAGTRAEDLSAEEKQRFMQQTEAGGLNKLETIPEQFTDITNLLTGGIYSIVARGLSKALGNTVLAKTPGMLREALDWQTMGASNLPSFAKNVYKGYKAQPKTMGDIAERMETSGTKVVPGTTTVARKVEPPLPNILGTVDNTARQITTVGKGTVGSYSDTIESELNRLRGTPLDRLENARQSPLGQLALKEDLLEQQGKPDTSAVYNINNSSLNYLEGQLERVDAQRNALANAIGHMKPNSKAPATNLLTRLETEAQTIRDEITQLRMQQNELLPIMVRDEQAKKAATDLAIIEQETIRAGRQFLLNPPVSERALPRTTPSPKEMSDINQQVLKGGREFLAEDIKPSDLYDPPIKGGYQGSTHGQSWNDLKWSHDKERLEKIRKQIVLDVGSNIRLEDGSVGKIMGMRGDGAIRIKNTKTNKEVYISPQSAQTSIIRNVAGEPEIVNNQLKVGRITEGASITNDKKALDDIDTPAIAATDVATGGDIIATVRASGGGGLSSLNTPVKPPRNARGSATGNATSGTQATSPTGGQNAPTGNVGANSPISSISGPSTGGPAPQLGYNYFSYTIPTYKVAMDYELKSGVPVFSKLYRLGREASDNFMSMKLDWGEKVDKIFKKEGLFRQSKKNREEHNKITQILEQIHSNDVNQAVATLAQRTGGSIKNTRIAVELRKLYDEAAAQGSIDPAMYLEYYSPRRQVPDDAIFNFLKQKTTDYMPFFQHPRAQNAQLLPREENALLLAHKYFDSWSRSKYLNTWHKDVAMPILDNANVIPNDTARKYFNNYMFDVMRYPRENAVEFNDRMYGLINTMGTVLGKQHLADDLVKKFGDERIGEVLGDKALSLQYKSFLGYRPIAALKNATQRIFALPFLSSGHIPMSGEANLIRGRYLAATKEGKEKVVRSGIVGTYQELDNLSQKIGKRITDPMHMYQKVEATNRGSIYLPIHDNILNDFKAGKSVDEVARHVNLHLYPELIQNKFKDMYSQGMVRDVREGLTDNAAHFLADWAQLITQFPYEKGGGPELFRQSPIWKQFGAFQSWSLFTLDYLSQNVADVLHHPINQRQKLYFLGKMYTYYTLLDAAMENAFDIKFHSNPAFGSPQDPLGSPTGQAARALMELSYSTVRMAQMDVMDERDAEYEYLDRLQAQSLGRLKSLSTPGIVRDIKNWTGEDSIIDSVGKVMGLD